MNVEEIIQAVSILPTFMPDDDIRGYYKYANLIHQGTIVDLGTGWGKSMAVLGLSNKENEIITCDPGDYPIYQNWVSGVDDYIVKINQIITDFSLNENVYFFPTTADELFEQLVDDIDLLHIDSWAEIRSIDTSEFLRKWIDKVLIGGYLLFRNYGRSDTEGWTKSIDKVTKDLKKIERIGLISIWQK